MNHFHRIIRNIGLFVDVQNLYHSAQNTNAPQLDYASLCKYVVAKESKNVTYHLHMATAYVVERENENTAHGFITKLSSLGFRVKRKTTSLHYTNDQSAAQYKGNWDMEIAADMARAMDFLDVLVLASGDGDFIPFLILAQHKGLISHVYSYKTNTSQALIDCCDRYINIETTPDLHI